MNKFFRPNPRTNRLPTVCVFDLDHTLIGGDVTADWTPYLLKHKVVTDPRFIEVDQEMERRYIAGNLDIHDYLGEVVPFFGYLTIGELEQHVLDFISEYIAPTVYEEGLEVIREARRLGMDIMIISASNTFIVRPVGERLFGIAESYGVDLKIENNHLTGTVIGVPPFQEGKIDCCREKLAALGKTLDDVVFFTDSRNDLPLARAAGDCYCVNPDEVLREAALENGWPILTWKREKRFKDA